jgi:tRNA threonylcarbamoyladenosine biosynthesis protein TsaE
VETEALGECWGRTAQRGQVIGLCGDLGAGKTQLVKGLARGLGITARVHSPTFALLNVYSGGRLTLFHLDLYRLETRSQIVDAGLDEYLEPNGVTVVEWAERWFGQRGMERLEEQVKGKDGEKDSTVKFLRWVQIDTLSETERRIMYEDIGA